MHPILASKTRLAFYMLAWIPLAGGAAFLSVRPNGSWLQSAAVASILAAFYAIVCLSPWYSCQVLQIGPSAIVKVLLNQVIAALVAGGLLAGLARLLGVPTTQMPEVFSGGVLLYLLAVALHYVLISLERSRESESREQEANLLAREAEIRALRAQINPHFLFNSLNSISALAVKDGQRAREMCIRLSDFLRSTLDLAEEDSISLVEELALAKAYLDVERVRFGARLRVEQALPRECDGCSVPALILQPLIENAVKHGIANMTETGEVRIEANCKGGRLQITVENDFEAAAHSPVRNGIGLENVRRRLRARYQNRATLSTQAGERRFSVALELPCES